MAIDVETVQSPGWWLKRLLGELDARQERCNLLDNWYRGDPPLPDLATLPTGERELVLALHRKARGNMASLITESVRERMRVLGFRTATSQRRQRGQVDFLGDKTALRFFKANGLLSGQKLVHRASLSMGDGYTIVGEVDDRIKAPRITAEDPRQVITAPDPVYPRHTLAALKTFADDIVDADRAFVYMPPEMSGGPAKVYEARRKRDPNDSFFEFDESNWSWEDEDGRDLATSRVPVFHWANRADMYGRTLGEFEDVIDDLERINLMLLQRIVVAVAQAFKQRAILGDLPDNDEDGNPIDYDEELAAGPGALWNLPKDVQMWESDGIDLTPLLESVKADERDVAATTRTPMFYLFPDAANGSAEGASLQREGLIFKTIDRIDDASDPWVDTMHTAFEVAGKKAGDLSDWEVIWAPPERFTLSERYAAAAQAKASDVPWRTRMLEVLQYTPEQVERMEQEREDDLQSPLASVLGDFERAVTAPTPADDAADVADAA